MTEEIPTKEETENFSKEISNRSHMHEDDIKYLENLP